MRNTIVTLIIGLVAICPSALAGMLNNGDGTVTDLQTGLMWQQDDAGPMTWEAGLVYCENLVLAGHADWRLPNRNELLSIVDFEACGPAIDHAAFPSAGPDIYWTSTTAPDLTTSAYIVAFTGGIIVKMPKGGNYYVRAVRGGT
jgi:hypothetical protein